MGMEADLRSLDARVRAVEEVAQELTRVHERLKVLAWVCGVLGVAIGGVLWYAVGEAREALALAELAKKAAADAPQQVAAARDDALREIHSPQTREKFLLGVRDSLPWFACYEPPMSVPDLKGVTLWLFGSGDTYFGMTSLQQALLGLQVRGKPDVFQHFLIDWGQGKREVVLQHQARLAPDRTYIDFHAPTDSDPGGTYQRWTKTLRPGR